VPPLKGGSGVGIASPPGIWVKDNPVGRQLVVPNIEEAEQLQGFPAGGQDPLRAHEERAAVEARR
jgi:DNA (cytosine-5)-methyltransferase 1